MFSRILHPNKLRFTMQYVDFAKEVASGQIDFGTQGFDLALLPDRPLDEFLSSSINLLEKILEKEKAWRGLPLDDQESVDRYYTFEPARTGVTALIGNLKELHQFAPARVDGQLPATEYLVLCFVEESLANIGRTALQHHTPLTDLKLIFTKASELAEKEMKIVAEREAQLERRSLEDSADSSSGGPNLTCYVGGKVNHYGNSISYFTKFLSLIDQAMSKSEYRPKERSKV